MENGRIRAEVARQGVRKSKVFASKKAAKDWAARQEYLIVNAPEIEAQGTFGELLERYARERSPAKGSARWEMLRVEVLRRDRLAGIALRDLAASDFADYRDRRLKDVQPGTVIREMVFMSAVLNVGVKEWGLLAANPLSGVKRPAAPPHRERRPTAKEIERMAHSAGTDLTKATARAFHAFLFAIETAMRAGEIAGLTWDRVNLDTRVARLTHTKNGRPREVPISSEALRLLTALSDAVPDFDMDQARADGALVFDLQSRQLDALFRKLRDRAAVSGLTFHDSRHEAITRLSKKLDVLALARMVGHSDLRQLQTYYNETAEELAARLD